VQTAYSLEEDVGISLAPVVVNGLYPEIPGLDADPTTAAAAAGVAIDDTLTKSLADAASFRGLRTQLQAAQVSRLAQQLPLPQIHLPYQFTSDFGPNQLDVLASALLDQIPGLPAISGGSPS